MKVKRLIKTIKTISIVNIILDICYLFFASFNRLQNVSISFAGILMLHLPIVSLLVMGSIKMYSGFGVPMLAILMPLHLNSPFLPRNEVVFLKNIVFNIYNPLLKDEKYYF